MIRPAKYILLLCIIIFNTSLFGQVPKNLSLEDAEEYLKSKGYYKSISKKIDGSKISWTGYSYPFETKLIARMDLAFESNGSGIVLFAEVKDLGEDYSFDRWKQNLPLNFTIFKQEDKEITAGDGTTYENSITYMAIEKIYDPQKDLFTYTSSTFAFLEKATKFLRFDGLTVDFRDIDTFDLYEMYNFFYSDFGTFLDSSIYETNNIPKIPTNKNQISITFRELETDAIAVALGMNDDSKVDIIVNPIKWKQYSPSKRFFIIYHELAHDIFNLKHGDGGKMMFNYSDESVTWQEFIEQREKMFQAIIRDKNSAEPELKIILPGFRKKLVFDIEKRYESEMEKYDNNTFTFKDDVAVRSYYFKDNILRKSFSIKYATMTEEKAIINLNKYPPPGKIILDNDYEVLGELPYGENNLYFLKRIVKLDNGECAFSMTISDERQNIN